MAELVGGKQLNIHPFRFLSDHAFFFLRHSRGLTRVPIRQACRPAVELVSWKCVVGVMGVIDTAMVITGLVLILFFYLCNYEPKLCKSADPGVRLYVCICLFVVFFWFFLVNV